jgi:C4-dicarboxylate-specific signal transduction histidine kinase
MISIPLCGVMGLLKKYENELSSMEQVKRQYEASKSRLLAAEKMAELGRLSGSIAHEMNNQLSAIMMSLDLAHTQLAQIMNGASETTQNDSLNGVNHWVTLGRKAATQSIDYMHRIKDRTTLLGQTVATVFPPGKVLEELAEILSPACAKEGCQIRILACESSSTLYGNPGEFSQALLNLIKNAAESYHARNDIQERPIWISLMSTGPFWCNVISLFI